MYSIPFIPAQCAHVSRRRVASIIFPYFCILFKLFFAIVHASCTVVVIQFLGAMAHTGPQLADARLSLLLETTSPENPT